MANYFSNHSQSRFLANSSSPTTTQQAQQPPPPRSRLPTSKHFSTSVTTNSVSERSVSKEKVTSSNGSSVNGSANVHPLRNTWVFWFRQQRAPGNKIASYEEGIKKISAFSSVESFWSLWTHLSPPSSLQPTTDYLLFHNGIRRPVWEDPLNLTGGKWIIRLKKGVADRIWEDLVLAIIGDQFDVCRPSEDAVKNAGASDETDWPEICGCTISVRQSEDIVSLWNRIDGDIKLREKIRDTIRRVLHLPPTTVMEYKSNNDSMQDKSSFRNSAIDRTPLS
ncbi:translation initiation factor eIF4e [Armillaria gallica]|uniref:Translation initiation factor eIF4e n=1 Tax=Armillaria gallica TaxID=47427 RepID=A0A2H3E0I0_ARMGA|nr:translation initiation factor eIF4e [Armillaria gallica]